MSSDIEETIKRIQSHKGVQGLIVLNMDERDYTLIVIQNPEWKTRAKFYVEYFVKF